MSLDGGRHHGCEPLVVPQLGVRIPKNAIFQGIQSRKRFSMKVSITSIFDRETIIARRLTGLWVVLAEEVLHHVELPALGCNEEGGLL